MMNKIKEEIIGRMPTDDKYQSYLPINPYESQTNSTPEGIRHPTKAKNNISDINELFDMMIEEYENMEN